MKRILLAAALICAGAYSLSAQTDAQAAAAAAAAAIAETPETVAAKPKPTYWKYTLQTQLNFAQASYTNWAKGGNDNVALSAFIDGTAKYAKDKLNWNNHIQLDYGFLYSSDKPILQKNKDRILLESTAGYKATEHLSYAAKFTFLSQFSKGYTYGTPSVDNPTPDDWWNAAVLKSGPFSPGIATLGFGIDWVPNNWLTINFSPLTGGFNIVTLEDLRKSYGMDLRKGFTADDVAAATAAGQPIGHMYRPVRFELGAQFTGDAKLKVNDNFEAGTHLILFSNYLKNPQNIRVNWDNRIMWKLAKYFTLTVTTNLIYDDTVLIKDENGVEAQRVQLLEGVLFGFTYTFSK